jgi:hypothetical protein
MEVQFVIGSAARVAAANKTFDHPSLTPAAVARVTRSSVGATVQK